MEILDRAHALEELVGREGGSLKIGNSLNTKSGGDLGVFHLEIKSPIGLGTITCVRDIDSLECA